MAAVGGAPLAGKVALVTAATDGIGLAVAGRLAAAGARVVLSSRREARVAAAVAQLRRRGLGVSGVVCHVGRPGDRQRLVDTALERHGGIDILVSNAAVNPVMGSALEADEAAWEKGRVHRAGVLIGRVHALPGAGPLQREQGGAAGAGEGAGPRAAAPRRPPQRRRPRPHPHPLQRRPVGGRSHQEAGDGGHGHRQAGHGRGLRRRRDLPVQPRGRLRGGGDRRRRRGGPLPPLRRRGGYRARGGAYRAHWGGYRATLGVCRGHGGSIGHLGGL
ncbi:putative dehydrogenase/reductase SDR family member 4-like 1 isoform X1 [Dromaius novaehollandiae]|uniref:putative dehydrogenase/reductase SDR family member 4-like 1 isoform X1 n=1 Tax=Dromaius novaehollandiae TaxID=8790 RepID=UPI00311FED00